MSTETVDILVRTRDNAIDVLKDVQREIAQTGKVSDTTRKAYVNVRKEITLQNRSLNTLRMAYQEQHQTLHLAVEAFQSLGSVVNAALNMYEKYTVAMIRENQLTDSVRAAQEKYNAAVAKFGSSSSQAKAALADLTDAHKKLESAQQQNILMYAAFILQLPGLIGGLEGAATKFMVLIAQQAASTVEMEAGTVALGIHTIAEGVDAVAVDAGAVALGVQTAAAVADTAATEAETVASGAHAIAEGVDTVAIDAGTIALGAQTVAAVADTVATEAETVASGFHAAAEGADAIATDAGAVSLGAHAIASNVDAASTGRLTLSLGAVIASLRAQASAAVAAIGGLSALAAATSLVVVGVTLLTWWFTLHLTPAVQDATRKLIELEGGMTRARMGTKDWQSTVAVTTVTLEDQAAAIVATSAAHKKLAVTIAKLTTQYETGVLSAQAFAEAMIHEGVAAEDVTKALDELVVSTKNEVQAIINASIQHRAHATAIANLTAQYKAGTLSARAFVGAMLQVGVSSEDITKALDETVIRLRAEAAILVATSILHKKQAATIADLTTQYTAGTLSAVAFAEAMRKVGVSTEDIQKALDEIVVHIQTWKDVFIETADEAATGFKDAFTGPMAQLGSEMSTAMSNLVNITISAIDSGLIGQAQSGMELFRSNFENIISNLPSLAARAMQNLVQLTNTAINAGLRGEAQANMELFRSCMSNKIYDLPAMQQKAMNQLIGLTNTAINSGLRGEAQKNIALFVECATSKQLNMVEEIDAALTSLSDKYKSNNEKILELTSAGKDKEAALYQDANKQILDATSQLMVWRDAIISGKKIPNPYAGMDEYTADANTLVDSFITKLAALQKPVVVTVDTVAATAALSKFYDVASKGLDSTGLRFSGFFKDIVIPAIDGLGTEMNDVWQAHMRTFYDIVVTEATHSADIFIDRLNRMVSAAQSAMASILAAVAAMSNAMVGHSIWPDLMDTLVSQTQAGMNEVKASFENGLAGVVLNAPTIPELTAAMNLTALGAAGASSTQTTPTPAPSQTTNVTLPVTVQVDGATISRVIERRLIANRQLSAWRSA